MKRAALLSAVLLSLLLFPSLGPSQDAVGAAAREEAEERYRTLAVRVERIEESLHRYEERAAKLGKDIYDVQEELNRLKSRNENAATQESLKRLQDAIKEVDEKRQDDNKKVLGEMGRLRSTLLDKVSRATVTPPPSIERPTPPQNPPSTKSPPENGYEYTIKKGDTLSGIVGALRSQGYKISQKQMEEANPGVNWSRLKVGNKVFIPPPNL